MEGSVLMPASLIAITNGERAVLLPRIRSGSFDGQVTEIASVP